MTLSSEHRPVGKGGQHDVIIVGGGIHGSMLALEATFRGLSVLLVEKGDFGEGTSANSLRIIHGGFRYLQTLDLKRFFDSVRERKWFLQNFPDLVAPLSVLMPLYGKGVRRPTVLRAALLLNDFLSVGRNRGIAEGSVLPRGRVVSSEETVKLFPIVDKAGLEAGAVWHDAWMPDSQRVIMETLRWARTHGAEVLNYTEATRLMESEGRVVGIETTDRVTGETRGVSGSIVINATGPWIHEVGERFGISMPALFQKTLVWNVLFDRPSVSGSAVAVTARNRNGHTYFLLPWKNRLLVGTGHSAWQDDTNQAHVNAEQMEGFMEDLNDAVPELKLSTDQMIRVFAGLVPAAKGKPTELADRPFIVDHGEDGAPWGLYSVCGVKFTTARRVADEVLGRLFPGAPRKVDIAPRSVERGGGWMLEGFEGPQGSGDELLERWAPELRRLIEAEAVEHLDDLVLRRTTLGDIPEVALEAAPDLCRLFEWNSERCGEEVGRLRRAYTMVQSNAR